ncbi:probable leucine-rich repeat receptor-like serine/threonine-protein kinase At3g14840 isoform X1 [Prunus avium]|uniref:Probable leucine-rich repeat receptor-like serine/threonine-protein kinase At3g14840 isoform X1 n=2 Tax=Prunus avium TaxID=42229 RepID=A0A6P5RML0_PRUAV|nr:probable leucine-rich repeat receptor-like serine/threonine-protein kinase At3g14840 isoform X1 [Prunus avium]
MARGVNCIAPKTIMNLIMLISVLCLCTKSVEVEAQASRLPAAEVEALNETATQVGKKDWNFSIDPCSNDKNWNTQSADLSLYENSLICNCSNPDGFCHVVRIVLKGQDLAGVLPPSAAKLPYLTRVDFTRNYLTGTIPREWASTKLEYLSVNVNNLSGPIPGYLGNISTLTYMSLKNNYFSGTVPPELGKLVNLNSLILSANNLTGELPPALTNLTKLTELRISSNNFTGRIPDFIQSWKQLQKLEIQASGLQGPIPSNISALSNLTDLRISDINGTGSEFPPLSSMTCMEYLLLRSCNLSGRIPTYISAMNRTLKTLDLSFNRLEGDIPDLAALTKLKHLYLTSNLLTGSIPNWIKGRDNQYQIDVSYNNFYPSSEPACGREYLNLFKSFSARDKSSFGECQNSYPCPEGNNISFRFKI